MGLTNYPYGVSSFGIPLIGSGPVLVTGKVFFVDSNTGVDCAGRGDSPSTPFASVDYAIGECRANKGDVIFAMPGHAETLTAAGSVTLDIAGVTIIGIGRGSLRPTFSFTTAVTASFLISAANCSVINCIFSFGMDALTNPIHVQGADFLLQDCLLYDGGATTQCTDVILTTTAADRLRIKGCEARNFGTAGANSLIALVAADNAVIEDCWFEGDFAVGVIDLRTTASPNIIVRNSYIRNLNSADIAIVDTITGSTGFIGPDLHIRVADHAANITEAITGATFVVIDPVYVVNLAGEKAMLINWTASTDA